MSRISARLVAASTMMPSCGVEAVHLDEQLVERLLALVVAAAAVPRAALANGVELVDEDDRRRFVLACSKSLRTREAPTPTNISMNSEARQREERHTGLARDSPRQQRFARARRADQQRAPRDAAAERRVTFRVLQEVDHLRQLLLGLVDPATSANVTPSLEARS